MTVLATDTTAHPSLAAAMREGSRAEHEAAENSSFMAELLQGNLTPAAYADLLVRLRAVYAALEETLRHHADDPLIAAVHDPALERLAAIEADLEYWLPNHAACSFDSPATTAYVNRIHAAAQEWSGHLVAHHYTRYLGDLSGGQAIGRMLARTYHLPTHSTTTDTGAGNGAGDGASASTGIAFYRFGRIAKPKPYKDAYRARLDGLGLDPDDIARVVAEVRTAFGLNQTLFTELGQRLSDYRAA